MTRELQSTLEASGIDWPVLRNHIPCMVHVTHLAVGEFMSSLHVKSRTKSSEAHECNQQFGENDNMDIRKSQRLRTEGNARINKVAAMKPGLAKIIEKVHTSWYFECPEADLHLAENACCINHANTWPPKKVHWLSKSQSPHCSTSDYGSEETLELHTGVARARLPITGIHTGVASKSKIQWIPAAVIIQDKWTIVKYVMEVLRPFRYWTLWMSKRHTVTLHHVITVYNDMFDQMDDAMRALAQKKTQRKEDLFPCCEVSSTEAFQILRWSESNHWDASYSRTHPRSFPEVATV